MPLPNDLIVYPNHGAGSACGKMMSQETTDTLGNQKKTNYALRADMTKDEFIKELLDGLTPPPGYFPKNVLMNIQGYESIDDIIDRGEQPLDPEAFEAAANETMALILDTREAKDFHKAFIPNSVNIGLDNNFAQWVGELIPDIKQQILLVTDPGKEEESIIRLARVGYDHAIGYLKGGIEAWKNAGKEVDHINRITVSQLKDKLKTEGINVFDVRKPSEYQSQHMINAENTPLNALNKHLSEFPKGEFVLHCQGGYRSMIAASILKQRGFDKVVDVIGGFDEILEEDSIPKSEYVCPTTLL
jgi:rhodanese-related sulfurtransferase